MVRRWQQSSKGLPAGAMIPMVMIHTEELPRVAREVERLSRNPENDWLEAGWNSPAILMISLVCQFVGLVCQMSVDALTVKKKTIESYVRPCRLRRRSKTKSPVAGLY